MNRREILKAGLLLPVAGVGETLATPKQVIRSPDDAIPTITFDKNGLWMNSAAKRMLSLAISNYKVWDIPKYLADRPKVNTAHVWYNREKCRGHLRFDGDIELTVCSPGVEVVLMNRESLLAGYISEFQFDYPEGDMDSFFITPDKKHFKLISHLSPTRRL